MSASVVAVSRSPTHSFSKPNELGILLVAGHGVDGDAHAGETVKHRSRVARDPRQPNLRQVHLIHNELFEELSSKGYAVAPGQLGENVTTRGLIYSVCPPARAFAWATPSFRSPVCGTPAPNSIASRRV